MDAYDLTTEEIEKMIAGATTQELICFSAIVYTVAVKRCPVRPTRFSKGELKRAIKRFRIAQKDCPDKAESFESTISLIRNNWLHKAA